MCVILYKPADVPCPSPDLLDACWAANPDGFGLAIADGNGVTIRKGAMRPAEAEVLYSLVQPEHSAIYHWRIATSGLVDAGNCHPFPVTTSADDLRKPFAKGLPYAVAHNGIISHPPKGSELSDTQIWVQKQLSKIVTSHGNMLKPWLDQQARLHSSRFVFMWADRKAYLAGGWHKEGPYLLSNQSYLWTLTKSYANKAWDYAPYAQCPMCGSSDTQELEGSMHSLNECFDCGTVFNDEAVFEPRNNEEYKEVI